MEHIAAILLLVGCSGDLKQCDELPAPTAIYETEEEALRMCGEWSRKPVKMPDGRTVIPVEYFHPDYLDIESVFIPWSAVQGERWPGEY